MDSLIFIVSGEQVWTYRSADGVEPKLRRISGEDHFLLKDIKEFRRNLCKSIGDIMYAAHCDGCQATKCFEEKNITIIYADISMERLQSFLSCFLPCKLLRVSALEDLLPAILLNAGRISLGEVIEVQFRQQAWRISVADDGTSTTEIIPLGESEPLEIGVESILKGLAPAWWALSDQRKVEQLQNDLDKSLAAEAKAKKESERLRTKKTELERDLEKNKRTLVISPDVLVLSEKKKKIITSQAITCDFEERNSPSYEGDQFKEIGDRLLMAGLMGTAVLLGGKRRASFSKNNSFFSPASGTLFPLKKPMPIGNDGGVIQAVISSNNDDTLETIMDWLDHDVIPEVNDALLQRERERERERL